MIGVVCCSDIPVETRGTQKLFENTPEIRGACKEDPESHAVREGAATMAFVYRIMHSAVVKMC